MRRFVYIAWRIDGACKIGMSLNPERRIAAIAAFDRCDVLLVHWVKPTALAGLVERRAHKILQAAALGHEWFSVDYHAAIGAVAAACSDGIEVSSGYPFPTIEKTMEYLRKKALDRAHAAQAEKETDNEPN